MKKIFLASLLLACSCSFAQQKTFKNPLLPSGADPWCIYHHGFYYYIHTTGVDLKIWKIKDITKLSEITSKTVWTPPTIGLYSKEIWAPELHYFNHKWYIYFAADDGKNENHRLYVLENKEKDPTKGEWIFKGKLTTPEDKWSIDGSVFENNGQLYLIWSGWEGDKNGQQEVFIAKMKNPYTVDNQRVSISKPEFEWELDGSINSPFVKVNEGPQALTHGNKIFIIYSASGCWTDSYALGMLTSSTNNDLMKTASWKKSIIPVFKADGTQNGVHAAGHNSFFRSPDGKEDWILYHANLNPKEGCGIKRSPRIQRFYWNKDGTPNLGKPLGIDIEQKAPSGTKL